MGRRNSIVVAVAILLLGALFAHAGAQPPPVPRVVINEVVTDPQTDWSTTDFDGTNGGGVVSQGVDEWIELLINETGVDLTGWTIELLDTSPTTGDLTSSGAFQVSRYVGAGSFTSTQAGDRLILGNVAGTASMNNDIYIVLKDAIGQTVDEVEIGDAGQPGDGAPAPGMNGNATSPADEAIARVPDGNDTDDDAADFVQQAATLGTSNGQPPTATPSPTSAPTGSVLINEVVTDPQTDWSTTNFDGTDGGGPISQGVDEWIELLIKSPSLNLTGWSIELLDSSPVVGDLTDAGAFQVMRYLGAGSFTNTQLGDRLILGNVAGSGSMNNDIFIVLKDVTGHVVDDVEIGFDPEGDGDDGAPSPGQNGNATNESDEAIARVPDGIDTDNDIQDFTQQPASLGSANPTPTPPPSSTPTSTPTSTATQTASPTSTGTPTPSSTPTATPTATVTPSPTVAPPPATPGSVLINEVVTDPQQDWNDSEGGNGVPFDSTPGTGTISSTDEWVELLNTSAEPIDLTDWSLVMTDSTPATQILGQGSAILRFSAGGSLAFFQPGERLVIGNPDGVLNNDVYIELRDASGHLVDDVEIGDDYEEDGDDGAPGAGQNGNALTVYEEAIARVPDGRDSNDDRADFEKHPATIGAHNGQPVQILAQLPVLNGDLGPASCEASIEVQNIGATVTKALILFWGEAGSCPPQCAGPIQVTCTGLLKPGSNWHLGLGELPPNARAGAVFSAFGQAHPAFRSGADMFADALCEAVLDQVRGDCDAYRRFRKAFEEHAIWEAGGGHPNFNFAAFPGQPIAVEVTRRCQSDTDPSTQSAYHGTPERELGRFDPLFGGFAYYTPLAYADWRGWNSTLYIQNAGLECTSVELWFKAEGECTRSQICEIPAIAPGETRRFDAGDCTGPGWVGSVWARTSQPAAVVVDAVGPEVLTTYNAMPAELNFTLANDTPFPGQPADPLFTSGSQVNFGPLIFREHQGWDTRIQVQNLSSVLSAKVKVYFLDASGDIIQTVVDWICPRGSQSFTLAAIGHLPGDWVGQVRVESQNWFAAGGTAVPAPNIGSIAQLVRWSGPAQDMPLEAMSYNLLTEEQVFDWQLAREQSGLRSGAGVISIPALSGGPSDLLQSTSHLAIQNAVPQPGVTNLVLFLYDQNGLLDFVCQSLNARQVDYINLGDWSYINPRFRGSAVISAIAWEHEIIDPRMGGARRNLLGLAAVKTERPGERSTSTTEPVGDQSSASVGVPVAGPFNPEPDLGFVSRPPLCPH